MHHLTRATRREYQKLGKLIGEVELDRYRPLLASEPTPKGGTNGRQQTV
jgi:hypothetical protein